MFLILGILWSVSATAPGVERAEGIARSSPRVLTQWAELQRAARSLRDPTLKSAVTELLSHPVPTFVPWDSPQSLKQRKAALVAAGLLDPGVTVEALFPKLAAPPESFLASAGSTLNGHHAHPGGLVEHTTFNLHVALALARAYRETAEVSGINLDALAAGVLLHDVMKPYLMGWFPDGTLATQVSIAGTASHHIFAVAEAIHRRLPAAVVVTLASAHDAPGTAEARVVGFLRAGALLAGEDPEALGLVKKGPDGGFHLVSMPTFEASISHLSDHDYVLSEPAAHLVNASLDRLIRAEAGATANDVDVRWTRYRIEAQLPILTLYAAMLQGGDSQLKKLLARWHLRVAIASSSQRL